MSFPVIIKREIPTYMHTKTDGRSRIFTRQQKESIVADYRERGSIAILIRKWNTYHLTIRRILAEYNVPLGDPYFAVRSRIDETELIREYQSGMSMDGLKIKFKTNHRRIKQIFAKHGIKKIYRTSEKAVSDETVDQIINCYYAGWPLKEMYKYFGFRELKMRRILRSCGISRYSRPEVVCLDLSESVVKKMKDLYDKTRSLHVVSEKFDYSGQVIKKEILRYYPDFVLSVVRPKYKDIWIYKYGKRKAGRMYKEHRKLLGASLKGRPGRPPALNVPGFGISGWYKHFYFRSLKELSFILAHEDTHKLECAERIVRVRYRDGNRFRYYYPDFLLNGTDIVEVKGKYQMSDPRVKVKMRALRKFCKMGGYAYTCRMVDIDINRSKIKTLYQEGKIFFSPRSMDYVAKYIANET